MRERQCSSTGSTFSFWSWINNEQILVCRNDIACHMEGKQQMFHSEDNLISEFNHKVICSATNQERIWKSREMLKKTYKQVICSWKIATVQWQTTNNQHQECGEKEPTLIIEQQESGEEAEQISTSLDTIINQYLLITEHAYKKRLVHFRAERERSTCGDILMS